ncbi:MAG: NUDIX hydrolase [Chloroflexi bacterium]|nr:NUDIX hydrolase [Chloroflexota bacterium]
METAVRYQAAIVQDDKLLMLKVWDHAFSGRTFWVIPGGGRLPNETEEACVVREAKEETNLQVKIKQLLLDEAEPLGDMYKRAKTYLCQIVAGTPQPGLEPEVDTTEKTTIQAIGWFDLRDPNQWDPLAANDPFTEPKLQQIRTALGYAIDESKH